MKKVETLGLDSKIRQILTMGEGGCQISKDKYFCILFLKGAVGYLLTFLLRYQITRTKCLTDAKQLDQIKKRLRRRKKDEETFEELVI